jgi:hypothetical protein
LTFLDHLIRSGDSIVGITDIKVLKDGVPDAAYTPVTGDDRTVAKEIKNVNKRQRSGQRSLAVFGDQEILKMIESRRVLLEGHEDTPAEIRQKKLHLEAYKGIQECVLISKQRISGLRHF